MSELNLNFEFQQSEIEERMQSLFTYAPGKTRIVEPLLSVRIV